MAKAHIANGVLITKCIGYCVSCGLPVGQHDDGCPKCGCEETTPTSPIKPKQEVE